MDQLGYYFDRECAEVAKTGLEFALNEKYNGKFAKKVKLLPSIMLVSRYGFRSIMSHKHRRHKKSEILNIWNGDC